VQWGRAGPLAGGQLGHRPGHPIPPGSHRLLLANLIKPLSGLAIARKPGIWHVITAYAWQLALCWPPVDRAARNRISQPRHRANRPQCLSMAGCCSSPTRFLPYLLRQALAPGEEAELGGSWFSLVAVHAGGIFLGASIFIPNLSAVLLGIALPLWFAHSCRSPASPGRLSEQVLLTSPTFPQNKKCGRRCLPHFVIWTDKLVQWTASMFGKVQSGLEGLESPEA